MPDTTPHNPIATTPAAVEVPYVGTADFTTRNATLEAMAGLAGLRLPETRLPPGTALLEIGEDARRAMLGEISALPDASEALRNLMALRRAERPVDTRVAATAARMDPTTGGLYGRGLNPDKSLAYTPRAIGQAWSLVKPPDVRGGLDLLLSLPPRIRAQVWDHAAESSPRDPTDRIVLRSAVDLGSGRRMLRAVTSERHSLETGDDTAIASILAQRLPRGARGRVTVGTDRTDLEFIWPTLDRQLVVGDLAQVALHVRNSETKAHALSIQPKLLRVLCYNFTTAWSTGGEAEIDLRHVGDLSRRIGQAIATALATVEPFVLAFGDAYRTPLPTYAPSRGEILGRIGRAFALPETTLSLAGQLWDADGARGAGDTLAGAVNALTRASQAQSYADAEVTERTAGRLVVDGWAALA